MQGDLEYLNYYKPGSKLDQDALKWSQKFAMVRDGLDFLRWHKLIRDNLKWFKMLVMFVSKYVHLGLKLKSFIVAALLHIWYDYLTLKTK